MRADTARQTDLSGFSHICRNNQGIKLCLCLELEGRRSLKLNVVLPSYLLPTGQETHAPLVRGLDAESPPQDPLQSPKKREGPILNVRRIATVVQTCRY